MMTKKQPENFLLNHMFEGLGFGEFQHFLSHACLKEGSEHSLEENQCSPRPSQKSMPSK